MCWWSFDFLTVGLFTALYILIAVHVRNLQISVEEQLALRFSESVALILTLSSLSQITNSLHSDSAYVLWKNR